MVNSLETVSETMKPMEQMMATMIRRVPWMKTVHWMVKSKVNLWVCLMETLTTDKSMAGKLALTYRHQFQMKVY